MNKIIIGIVSSLITVYVTWLSYTVYDLSKTTVLIDYKMNRVNEALQMFSEEINKNSNDKKIFYIKSKRNKHYDYSENTDSNLTEF